MLLQEDISMAEPEQIVEEYVMPEGMLALENASFYVELKEKCNTYTIRYVRKSEEFEGRFGNT